MSIYKADTILKQFPKELIENWNIKTQSNSFLSLSNEVKDVEISIQIDKIYHIGQKDEHEDIIEINCYNNYNVIVYYHRIFTIIL